MNWNNFYVCLLILKKNIPKSSSTTIVKIVDNEKTEKLLAKILGLEKK